MGGTSFIPDDGSRHSVIPQPVSKPAQERDYAYAGSFYFFAVWIGLGVLALYEALSGLLGEKLSAPAAGTLCMVVPVLMAVQNWDDHDRSGRYLARDVAFNYLNSCAPMPFSLQMATTTPSPYGMHRKWKE